MGGRGIVSMIWYTLAQIGGKIPEYFFCGWWDNQLLRVGERKIFLDVNPDLFQTVVDILNKQKDHVS